MKIFNSETCSWDSKVNFVDDNNVFLGYDMAQSCCEHASWFISDNAKSAIPDDCENMQDLDGWQFDTSFFEVIGHEDEYDEGGIAVFRITKGDKEKFIHLFNCHNGYYGHGFSFTVGDKEIQEGVL